MTIFRTVTKKSERKDDLIVVLAIYLDKLKYLMKSTIIQFPEISSAPSLSFHILKIQANTTLLNDFFRRIMTTFFNE